MITAIQKILIRQYENYDEFIIKREHIFIPTECEKLIFEKCQNCKPTDEGRRARTREQLLKQHRSII